MGVPKKTLLKKTFANLVSLPSYCSVVCTLPPTSSLTEK